ncbi:hypothetical protein MY3296_000611 [Beauveria thailandica]
MPPPGLLVKVKIVRWESAVETLSKRDAKPLTPSTDYGYLLDDIERGP